MNHSQCGLFGFVSIALFLASLAHLDHGHHHHHHHHHDLERALQRLIVEELAELDHTNAARAADSEDDSSWSSSEIYVPSPTVATTTTTTTAPTSAAPTTVGPTTEAPTTAAPTTVGPTTEAPTTASPTGTPAPTYSNGLSNLPDNGATCPCNWPLMTITYCIRGESCTYYEGVTASIPYARLTCGNDEFRVVFAPNNSGAQSCTESGFNSGQSSIASVWEYNDCRNALAFVADGRGCTLVV
eukprot:CAMPEP_0197023414 /NCGR_PEP_ID=MMETSP1384-20130603/4105_1 /TAXON_ID=29189 /ORGANISM="Ammonia sp." /LENGTH=241 /DNA_ID=CAMNT_0042451617 /DNA_START=99 /DNA_END=824 /DNA_ORIENTATION=-